MTCKARLSKAERGCVVCWPCCVLQEPLPHVSLAWTPGDEAERLQPWLDTIAHDPIQLKVRSDSVGLTFFMRMHTGTCGTG